MIIDGSGRICLGKDDCKNKENCKFSIK